MKELVIKLPKIKLYLSEKSMSLLKELTVKNDMTASSYVSRLISKAAREKQVSLLKISEQIKEFSSIQRNENANITGVILLINELIAKLDDDEKEK